ncbi:nitroreductase family protein [Candidatus Bathyarchaeota archaeon]|nr:nitroreductase family protein [Candidatus Bathyarchaeota archaeon]
MPETVDELATRRKTARKFTRTPVNSDDIFYCIKVAIQAPSGANRQPWCFLIIDDPKLRKKLRTACEEQEKSFHGSAEDSLKQWFKSKNITWRKPHLTDAPMLLAVFSNQEMPYGTESTWLSIGYFTIALEERYLSTVTYTPPYPEDLKGLFNAPEGYKLETILPIGYSADAKPKEKRKSIGSFIYRNAWSRTTETIA